MYSSIHNTAKSATHNSLKAKHNFSSLSIMFALIVLILLESMAHAHQYVAHEPQQNIRERTQLLHHKHVESMKSMSAQEIRMLGLGFTMMDITTTTTVDYSSNTTNVLKVFNDISELTPVEVDRYENTTNGTLFTRDDIGFHFSGIDTGIIIQFTQIEKQLIREGNVIWNTTSYHYSSTASPSFLPTMIPTTSPSFPPTMNKNNTINNTTNSPSDIAIESAHSQASSAPSSVPIISSVPTEQLTKSFISNQTNIADAIDRPVNSTLVPINKISSNTTVIDLNLQQPLDETHAPSSRPTSSTGSDTIAPSSRPTSSTGSDTIAPSSSQLKVSAVISEKTATQEVTDKKTKKKAVPIILGSLFGALIVCSLVAWIVISKRQTIPDEDDIQGDDIENQGNVEISFR